MQVIDLTPRGYCHGVLNALAIVKKVIKTESYPRPIYVLGQIVHNEKITKAFKEYGVISLDQKGKTRLEMLDNITSGTVIFTAHGVSDQVIERAKEKGLTYLNATCRDVIKVHKAVKEKLAEGYKVIYIGHRNHPEPEAVLAISSDIYFVEDEKDAMMLPTSLIHDKVFVTNQTTLSRYDIDAVLKIIETKYPNYLFDNEICHATTVRQDAVKEQDKVDLMLVVGDKKSSNSNKLAYVGEKAKEITSHLIGGVEDIDLSWLKGIQSVSVTSGASTPTIVTEEVIKFLKQYNENDPTTWDHQTNILLEDIL
ncbi:MAG: 4-hydroxy-3-methylbut-2-enyl diphosphate reductase [Tenericutes bacterium GWC2_34_14]|nr:MAG: 4-hydroxy-3-methylbut-2-enyl diphosphate reductase [Tenericutes bacterium GWA2_35_7]OHE29324.1 MAG: 4-hydroxy-3-methylbut-2-enyl diphosphate reductase [Tenericutes bacterium GWC2_34_14]OHE34421.1 MAG: 4-hydroxy-3-methylbut-2-enyl diphosphate reductase [Tenericutes bacterium GWE2_34_108]OHE35777.1 MAG: 4-hydroxy-3-methylbut-2-enyl diphosphate reductase [Tenericutes bacterium GWF1_35_14]OHE39136.1 MAG: 4-hydroxy-3-methylbut-2-enyl diphosphate reductase [Tenericutes bacterium GWF2_35_184]